MTNTTIYIHEFCGEEMTRATKPIKGCGWLPFVHVKTGKVRCGNLANGQSGEFGGGSSGL